MPSLEMLDLGHKPALAQPQSLTQCFQTDTDLWGYDLGVPRAMEPSAEACQQHCLKVPGCQFFTWTSGDGGCYVKSSDAGHRVTAGITSGPRHCPGADGGAAGGGATAGGGAAAGGAGQSL